MPLLAALALRLADGAAGAGPGSAVRRNLEQVEEAMLALHDTRDARPVGRWPGHPPIGRGRGSSAPWMAGRFPAARITAVSTRPQRESIEARCRQRASFNVGVMPRDVNARELEPSRFGRCVSIEMFEHLRTTKPWWGESPAGGIPGHAAPLWFRRWRIWLIACAEMFGYVDGQEWLVAHDRFARPENSV